MRTLLVLLLVVPLAAHAQRKKSTRDDAPTPYSEQEDEDDRNKRDLPDHSEPTRERHEETQVEQDDRMVSLASSDDPNIGLSGEIVMGAMLMQASRGGVQPQFGWGLRFTWEWSRTLLTDEFWREVFFADVMWVWTADAWSGDSGQFIGTTGGNGVYDKANFHYFLLAPAVAWPIGKTPLAVSGQIGLGFGYQTSTVNVESVQNTISASRFVLQYGAGVRFRIGVVPDNKIRVSFRLELTRFRRGYMDDTLVGGSIGITF
jgi:hypothetical protein